jgi:hypothetical protein
MRPYLKKNHHKTGLAEWLTWVTCHWSSVTAQGDFDTRKASDTSSTLVCHLPSWTCGPR